MAHTANGKTLIGQVWVKGFELANPSLGVRGRGFPFGKPESGIVRPAFLAIKGT